MEEKLLSIEEYARKIENELREKADFNQEKYSKIANAFAKVRFFFYEKIKKLSLTCNKLEQSTNACS